MRTLVLGGDGYLGWPTALHLSAAGHHVAIADNFARRGYDQELGATSLVPIAPLDERVKVWQEISNRQIRTFVGDLTDASFTTSLVDQFRPETIVHFAEQRSAPYSMIDQPHAVYTQVNNVVGTLNVLYAIADIDPTIHLVKLGSMGEYGTPNIDIEEGWLEVTHKGRTDRVLYPKRPGSFYHLSPAHRLRERASDSRNARHPRHRRMHSDRCREPGRSGGVPGVQPVHRAVLRAPVSRDDP